MDVNLHRLQRTSTVFSLSGFVHLDTRKQKKPQKNHHIRLRISQRVDEQEPKRQEVESVQLCGRILSLIRVEGKQINYTTTYTHNT